jgi:hypothetical protein
VILAYKAAIDTPCDRTRVALRAGECSRSPARAFLHSRSLVALLDVVTDRARCGAADRAKHQAAGASGINGSVKP